MQGLYRAIISPEASSDLSALHAYISRISPDNAAKMVERILAGIESLRVLPHRTMFAGQSAKVRHPVRTLPVKPYVIYFRALDDDKVIRILTIRHGARLPPETFD